MTIQYISRELHSDKRWRRPSSYQFAAKDTVCPLVVQELPKAVLALPIAFIATQDGYSPVSVQGLEGQTNLFVGEDGRWLARYTPALYRGYPFLLANNEQNEQVLCIDEECSPYTNELTSERFFTEDGQPAKVISDVLIFLTQIYNNRQATYRVCAMLQKHQLIEPWQITLEHNSSKRTVEGLFRINEEALNGLGGEAFKELHESDALLTAYCQLLSMQHIGLLSQLLREKQNSANRALTQNLDLALLNDSGNISFEHE